MNCCCDQSKKAFWNYDSHDKVACDSTTTNFKGRSSKKQKNWEKKGFNFFLGLPIVTAGIIAADRNRVKLY